MEIIEQPDFLDKEYLSEQINHLRKEITEKRINIDEEEIQIIEKELSFLLTLDFEIKNIAYKKFCLKLIEMSCIGFENLFQEISSRLENLDNIVVIMECVYHKKDSREKNFMRYYSQGYNPIHIGLYYTIPRFCEGVCDSPSSFKRLLLENIGTLESLEPIRAKLTETYQHEMEILNQNKVKETKLYYPRIFYEKYVRYAFYHKEFFGGSDEDFLKFFFSTPNLQQNILKNTFLDFFITIIKVNNLFKKNQNGFISFNPMNEMVEFLKYSLPDEISNIYNSKVIFSEFLLLTMYNVLRSFKFTNDHDY